MFHLAIGFSERVVAPQELRDAQAAFLQGTVNAEQRSLIDACMSWVISYASNAQVGSRSLTSQTCSTNLAAIAGVMRSVL